MCIKYLTTSSQVPKLAIFVKFNHFFGKMTKIQNVRPMVSLQVQYKDTISAEKLSVHQIAHETGASA